MKTDCTGKDNEHMDPKRSRLLEIFNAQDPHEIGHGVPNACVGAWFEENVPSFVSSDTLLEEIFAFRYWTYRKHIRPTPEGHVVTEFLPDVPWSGTYNAIACPVAHHIREGRWLADQTFLKDYVAHYAIGKGSRKDVLTYQNGFVAAAAEYLLAAGDPSFAREIAPGLCDVFARLKEKHRTSDGLYWADDGYDGMEYSLSGPGLRPTITSYVYGGGMALAALLDALGDAETACTLRSEAFELREKAEKALWDEKERFYKTVSASTKEAAPDFERKDAAHDVRELIGYLPFLYDMAPEEHADAFRLLCDPLHFYAPFGPTTADRSHPRFRTVLVDHECLWDGPSWPYATAQTLSAAIRTMEKGWDSLSRDEFADLLHVYAASHFLSENGEKRYWIDEDLDPDDGHWIARTLLKTMPGSIPDRGIWYNHSTFCDLVISGLAGVHPGGDTRAVWVDIHPLAPQDMTFSLSDLRIAGRTLGVSFEKGKVRVSIDGREAGGEGKYRLR